MGMSGGSSGSSRAMMNEINVTPLVDVMLVLLIMFMVTTPLMQQGIEVDLPKTASSGVAPKEDPIILVIEASGKLSINKQNISLETLRDKIATITSNRKNKEIYIQADKKTDYGAVATAMAELRAAGIQKLGLITLPK